MITQSGCLNFKGKRIFVNTCLKKMKRRRWDSRKDGGYHTLGLKADGTVVAAGYSDDGRCDVGGWTDIVAICGGAYHSVGLRSDGTLVATGSNRSGQCNVGSWTDIVAIAAGAFHTIGLKADGSVLIVGTNASGQCNSGALMNGSY